jgi:hypothetical protein
MISRLIIFICACCFFFGCSDSRSITDMVSDRILCQLAKEMKKKGLIAIGSGGGCTIDKKINDISMTFAYGKVLSLNHARELMVESIQILLKLINSNPDNKQYFEHFPAPVEIIVISILSEPCPTDPECVEAVSILKGKIYYDVNHPIPHIAPYLTLKEESFEEALKIVESRSSLANATIYQHQ